MICTTPHRYDGVAEDANPRPLVNTRERGIDMRKPNRRNGPLPRPLAERLWPKVDKDGPNGCWIWTGARTQGYGSISRGPGLGNMRAHRATYELLVGPIPEGLQLDHLCRVRACCNPSHLEPVTARENLLRGETITTRNAAKTHCPKGHEYTSENTSVKLGSRYCRHCDRINHRKAA